VKHVEVEYAVANPDLTEQELRQKFFVYCLFCWPALIEKIEIDVRFEDDDDDKTKK